MIETPNTTGPDSHNLVREFASTLRSQTAKLVARTLRNREIIYDTCHEHDVQTLVLSGRTPERAVAEAHERLEVFRSQLEAAVQKRIADLQRQLADSMCFLIDWMADTKMRVD